MCKVWLSTKHPMLMLLPNSVILHLIGYDLMWDISSGRAAGCVLALADVFNRVSHVCVYVCVQDFSSYWFSCNPMAISSFLLTPRPSVFVGSHSCKWERTTILHTCPTARAGNLPDAMTERSPQTPDTELLLCLSPTSPCPTFPI